MTLSVIMNEEVAMSEQVHKRLTDEQVKMILRRYVAKEMTAAEAMELLGLKRRQFFEWRGPWYIPTLGLSGPR